MTCVRRGAPPPKMAAVAFSAHGPRVRLSLRNVLRGISPFQLSGPIDEVPETAVIEIPFSIVEPQLSLGRIAVSPAQFKAALPEEYRSLLKIEEADLPIALPLQEVLQNLPNESSAAPRRPGGNRDHRNVRDALQREGGGGRGPAASLTSGPVWEIGCPEAEHRPAGSEFSPTPCPPHSCRDACSGRDPSVSASEPTPANEPSQDGELGIERRLSPPDAAPPAAATNAPVRAMHVAFDTDEALDARRSSPMSAACPGCGACAVVFSDGLSLAGNIPAEYQADALCAIAPSILNRIDEQMAAPISGALRITLFCAKTPGQSSLLTAILSCRPPFRRRNRAGSAPD